MSYKDGRLDKNCRAQIVGSHVSNFMFWRTSRLLATVTAITDVLRCIGSHILFVNLPRQLFRKKVTTGRTTNRRTNKQRIAKLSNTFWKRMEQTLSSLKLKLNFPAYNNLTGSPSLATLKLYGKRQIDLVVHTMNQD